ncbi:MAG: hypothetical protein H6500_04990 [Candidatus Woesearchaeota archaeon]|nr:hypothetical protein [Nanoarchaeota archaeon]USN43717.1 MAG: hypothetical protein H6500_04990 [Candidatus Woesearchaeota archaeon]
MSDSILKQAREEAVTKEKETDEYIARLKMESQDRLVAYEKAIRERRNSELVPEVKKIEGTAKKKAKERVLEEKCSILETVKNNVRKTILALDDKQKEKLLERLYKNACRHFSAEHVRCNPQDQAILQKIVGKNIKVSKDARVKNGMILEKNFGKHIVDYTFDRILAGLFAEKEEELQKILFGK